MPASFSVKPGRNDPCPCGSGKKYKRCCLPKTAESEETLWARERAASDDLSRAILRYAERKFGMCILDAWDDFHLGQPDSLDHPDFDEGQIFFPYFLFHWTPTRPRGRRTGATRGGVIAKAFMLENARRLTEMQRQVLEQSMTQPLTFYEVISSHPGERIVLRDILTGQEKAVREHTASKTVENGDIIFAQVLPMQGITTLGCCAPVRIPPRMKAEVIALRKKLRRKAKRENGEIWAQDLARYENDIREVYLNIRDLLNTPPRICNTDGDPLVLHTITFEIESPQAAFEALAPLAKGLSKEQLLSNAEYDADGRLRKTELDWIKRGNRKFKTWDNTILGTIRILDRSLVAEVNSEKRAVRLRSEIEKRLGATVVHKSTVMKSYEELMEREEEEASPGAEQDRAELEEFLQDPEIQKRGRELVQRQLEGWVDEKVPILGGRTPMQAVKDPDGREIVEALLNEFERRTDETSPGFIRPDFTVLRRRLNLPQKSL